MLNNSLAVIENITHALSSVTMLRHLNPLCGPITLVNNTILVGF
jgi:hypothetical protein